MSNVRRHKHPPAMRRLLLLPLIACATAAVGQSLQKLDQVDLIELDARTSQIRLLVVLGEERVNTRQSVKALYKKFNNYQDFITSGQVLAAVPNGSRSIRPVVVLVAPRDATSGEVQNLEGLKLAASKVGAAVEVLPYVAALKPKPIPITRAATKSGV